MKRHRWGERQEFEHKTEKQCLTCGIVQVSRSEHNGFYPVYWKEFYRDLDRIECDGTPACEPVEASV